jgi:hypothetical protein
MKTWPLWCIAAALLTSTVHAANPVVTIDEQLLTATEVTPGGDVVVFSLWRDRTTWQTEQVRVSDVVPDTDIDGTITYDPGRRIALQSVWFVADLATGDYAAGSPQDFSPRASAPDVLSFMQDERNETVAVSFSGPEVIALLVRPGVGAWRLDAGDGADGDDDSQQDGTIELDVSSFSPVGDSRTAAPPALLPGDVIVTVNPRNLDYIAAEYAVPGR